MHQIAREMGKKLGVERVATNAVYYLNRRDAYAHEALVCIGTNNTLDDPGRFRLPGDQYYLKSLEEMSENIADDEAIRNTVKIADQCSLELDLGKLHLPVFHPPDGKNENEYLKELGLAGLRQKLNTSHIPAAYQKRFELEYGVIQKMKYASYFLIVWDFIYFAKKNNIPVGPGRGSAAGSLVSYSLDITELDPIEHGLIFERFLNPDRISMPDIDVDFCQDRRDEVIQYVRKKYGQDNVAQIISEQNQLEGFYYRLEWIRFRLCVCREDNIR